MNSFEDEVCAALAEKRGFFGRPGSRLAHQRDYRPGHYVHPIQARKCMEDVDSLETVAIASTHDDVIEITRPHRSSSLLTCAETPRLIKLLNGSAQSNATAPLKPFKTADGHVAILSERWNLLALPIGATEVAPRQIPLPNVFRINDGAIAEGLVGRVDLSFALFSIRKLDEK